jgi:hypothetical protein
MLFVVLIQVLAIFTATAMDGGAMQRWQAVYVILIKERLFVIYNFVHVMLLL